MTRSASKATTAQNSSSGTGVSQAQLESSSMAHGWTDCAVYSVRESTQYGGVITGKCPGGSSSSLIVRPDNRSKRPERPRGTGSVDHPQIWDYHPQMRNDKDSPSLSDVLFTGVQQRVIGLLF